MLMHLSETEIFDSFVGTGKVTTIIMCCFYKEFKIQKSSSISDVRGEANFDLV